MPLSEVCGLVLAGGRSLRMGADKGLIIYQKLSPLQQRQRLVKLLQTCGLETFLSCRQDQLAEADLANKVVVDQQEFADPLASKTHSAGPGVGLLSAHLFRPEVAWLVLACDFPFADEAAIKTLLNLRKTIGKATAYVHADQTVEPLFAIWEPETLAGFLDEFRTGQKSPRRSLERSDLLRVVPPSAMVLANINSLAEAKEFEELS